MRVVSEGPIKITKAVIDGSWRRRASGHRLIIRDRDCRGLALIVNSTAMTWSFAYRPRGTDPVTGHRWPNRTLTLGNPATHSPDDARTAANQTKGQAAAGADPVAERKVRVAAERHKRGATLRRLLDDYAQVLPRRPKMRGTGVPSPEYVADELAQIRFALVAMEAEALPAADLAEAAVRKLLGAGITGAAGTRARFGALSRFLDWCQDAGHIRTNPCALIARARRPRAPQSRSHYLTHAELARLWEASGQLREPVWRDLVRFLIAVPCRRGEAAWLEWSHLNIAASEWRQPGHMTKDQEAHRLHLNSLAIEVLEARLNALDDAQSDQGRERTVQNMIAGMERTGLVFPAPISGRAVDTFSGIKNALASAAGLTGWTWHDFRRSFATALGEAGVPEAVADAVLNHRQSATRGGVLGVYQRASRWPEQVRAMELWGRQLSAALAGLEGDAKVVSMAKRQT